MVFYIADDPKFEKKILQSFQTTVHLLVLNNDYQWPIFFKTIMWKFSFPDNLNKSRFI